MLQSVNRFLTMWYSSAQWATFRSLLFYSFVLFYGLGYYKVLGQCVGLFLSSSLTIVLGAYSDTRAHTTASTVKRACGRACLEDIDGQYNIHVI
jgi:hypothetical protein